MISTITTNDNDDDSNVIANSTEQNRCWATNTSLHSHCFILTCSTSKFGNLYVACECRTNDTVEVHMSDWQITLCKDECDLPLIEPSAA